MTFRFWFGCQIRIKTRRIGSKGGNNGFGLVDLICLRYFYMKISNGEKKYLVGRIERSEFPIFKLADLFYLGY